MRDARFLERLRRAFYSSAVLFSVAFLVRVLVAGQLISSNQARFYVQNEQARIAWAVVSGYGFSSPWPHTPLEPTAQQPPVYPFLLAGIFKITGAYSTASLRIALIFNAIFAGLTAVLIYRIGKIWLSEFFAAAAGWVWACWIYEIVLACKLWESSLSALWLTMGLWMVGLLAVSPRTILWVAFGAWAALAALTNTTLLAVFICFWIWLWFARPERSAVFRRQWIGSLVVCLLLLSPWIVRNYVVFHRLIPVRDNFGLELWIGNHEGVTHLYDFRGSFPLIDPGEYNRLGELPFMEAKREVAMQFIRRQPLSFIKLCGQRIVDFWSAPPGSPWMPISVAAWVGLLLLLFRKRLSAAPFAIVLGIFPLVYYVTHPWSTYRHPIEPVMILMIAYAVEHIFTRLKFRRASRAETGNSSE